MQVAKYCDYCGCKIYAGDTYYLYDMDVICPECAAKYAMDLFMEEAKEKIATLEDVYERELSERCRE